MTVDILNFGPTVESEVAQEFCEKLRLMRITTNGEEKALRLLDSVLESLSSQKETKLIEAIIKDLEHCQVDFLQRSTFYQNYLMDAPQQNHPLFA